MMRVLVVTKIFPNAVEPDSNPFNRQQFAALGKLCDVEVMATIPWYPGAGLFRRWSAAGRLASVPSEERIEGLPVRHPRTLFVPRYGHSISALLYAASLAPSLLSRTRKVDVVLGSWAYPDGAAAIGLARMIGVPSVVKVHGSDINVLAKRPGPRRSLERNLPRAARIVAVSRPLADAVVELGVERERVAVVQNGVDGSLFHPRDRDEARRSLGLPVDGKRIVYVGRLEETKGVIDLLDAFAQIDDPSLHLTLVGGGAAKAECEKRAISRVQLAGPRPLEEIPRWMAAADVVTLPSWNEGTPNVILEAFACGRPVVATCVGGIPDLVTDAKLGELVPARDVNALAKALAWAAHQQYDAAAIAQLGSRGGWADSAAKLHRVLLDAVSAP
jgi:glycosyltransferase involved in cell wall biosynthesis